MNIIYKDFKMEILFCIMQVGSIASHGSLRLENISWLWWEKGREDRSSSERCYNAGSEDGRRRPWAKGVRQPLEVREGIKMNCLQEPPEECCSIDASILALWDLFWTSDFQNCKVIHFCCFKSLCDKQLQTLVSILRYFYNKYLKMWKGLWNWAMDRGWNWGTWQKKTRWPWTASGNVGANASAGEDTERSEEHSKEILQCLIQYVNYYK